VPEARLIHITGASGSGTSTLGRAVAAAMDHEFIDADDVFWLPTAPPYMQKRSREGRLALLEPRLQAGQRVVVAGSVVSWGSSIEDAFDLIVYLAVPTDVRLVRLRARELARCGVVDEAFLDWAAQYDEGGLDMRSAALHEQWLSRRACNVLRLDGGRPIQELVIAVLRASVS
jgi:adenylate kinase family enzyme